VDRLRSTTYFVLRVFTLCLIMIIFTSCVPAMNISVQQTQVSSSSDTYFVQSGDTLYSIATKYGMTIDELKNLNNIRGNSISAGQMLKVPRNTNNNVARVNESNLLTQSQTTTPPRQTSTTSSQPTTPSRQSNNTSLEMALPRAAQEVIEKVPQRSRIAIVYITAPEKWQIDYILGELEYIWVKDGHIITDRSQLERVRQEQRYQLSGEVDDATAVSIGKIAGADIIVTGGIDGEGSLRRLRLRALNAQTAQVVYAASVKF